MEGSSWQWWLVSPLCPVKTLPSDFKAPLAALVAEEGASMVKDDDAEFGSEKILFAAFPSIKGKLAFSSWMSHQVMVDDDPLSLGALSGTQTRQW